MASVPESVPVNLLRSDRFLNRVLDNLERRADMDIPCAVWDLKASLIDAIIDTYAR